MNKKDIGKIKRRLKPDKKYPSKLKTVYLKSDCTEICRTEVNVQQMSDGESEKYMSFFKKILSGKQGQNMIPMTFGNNQVLKHNEGEYGLLLQLKESELKNEDLVDVFLDKMIEWARVEYRVEEKTKATLEKEDNKLILLMYDSFDVIRKQTDDEIDEEASVEVFGYIMCCVCPVKRSKPVLYFSTSEKEFVSRSDEWTVGLPEVGFMYPSFEDGAANLYEATMYTKDKANCHADLAKMIMGIEIEMAATEQTDMLNAVLHNTLKEECSLDIITEMNDHISEMIKEHEKDNTSEMPVLNSFDIKKVLEDCGVSEEKVEAFENEYKEVFGDKAISAINIASAKEMKITTPSVQVYVDAEHSDLVTTKMIDGVPYITIQADGNIEVNGVLVNV